MSNWRRHVGIGDAPDMSNCLGIFGLSLYTTEQELEKEFSKFGSLEKVQVITLIIGNLWLTHLSVKDNLYFFQGPEFGEFFFYFPFGCVETESKNAEAVGHFWSIPTSNMPPTVTHGGSTSRPEKQENMEISKGWIQLLRINNQIQWPKFSYVKKIMSLPWKF